jgi:hypothetical protein
MLLKDEKTRLTEMPLIIGDSVRVSESISSDFAGRTGMIVALERRQAGTVEILECTVEFDGTIRRQFLGVQLSRANSEQKNAL